MTAAEKLFAIAKDLNLRTADIADIVNLHEATVRSWRRDRQPTVDALKRFIEHANQAGHQLSLDWFYDADDAVAERPAPYNGMAASDFAAFLAIRTSASAIARLASNDNMESIRASIQDLLRELDEAIDLYREVAQGEPTSTFRARAMATIESAADFAKKQTGLI